MCVCINHPRNKDGADSVPAPGAKHFNVPAGSSSAPSFTTINTQSINRKCTKCHL